MAVEIKYVVVRNGKEVMTFADKKAADAYDRQLDIAESLQSFFDAGDIELALDADQLDELTLFLAKHRDAVIQLLKGKSGTSATKKPAAADAAATAAKAVENGVAKPLKRGKTRAAA